VSVYTLKTPITVGTETITEINVGAIKGKHLRSLPVDSASYTMDVIMNLAAKITGQPAIVFDEMDAADLTEICEIVGERLAGGQQTGVNG
jgi:hypothetical protein